MFANLKAEFETLASTRIAWFLLGVYVAGNDVMSVFESLRAFVGV